MPSRTQLIFTLAATTGLLVAAGTLTAVGLRPAAEASAAALAEARLPVIEAFPAEAVGTYATDAVHSSVIFRTTHARVANFYGRFNSMDGTFVLAENPADSTFTFSIDTTSIDTNNANRDDHLRSPDFFNVEQFDEATFTTTGIEPADEGPHTLKGDLTLNGVTKPIEADLTFTGTGEFRGSQVAGFEAVFTINRSDFGITTYLGPIGDEVTVIVAVEGKKQ